MIEVGMGAEGLASLVHNNSGAHQGKLPLHDKGKVRSIRLQDVSSPAADVLLLFA